MQAIQSSQRASSGRENLAAAPQLLGWVVLVLVSTAEFCLSYFQDDRPFLNLHLYLQGRGAMPYQSRILMQWVLRAALKLPVVSKISSHLSAPINDPSLLVLFLTSWLSLMGAVLFTSRSLSALTSDVRFSRWASLLVVYMAYFHFPLVYGWNFLLPYDLPSLFFFSACLYCIITSRMAWLYPLFVLGVLNRETLLFSVLFLALWYWKAWSRTRIATHFVALVAIWSAIRLYLGHRFHANPIEPGSEHLFYKLPSNLHFLIDPKHWPVLAAVFGFTLPLVLFYRARLDLPMRRCLWVLPVWFAVMMMVGVIVEVRVFSELISYMAIALAMILHSFWNTPMTSSPTA